MLKLMACIKSVEKKKKPCLGRRGTRSCSTDRLGQKRHGCSPLCTSTSVIGPAPTGYRQPHPFHFPCFVLPSCRSGFVLCTDTPTPEIRIDNKVSSLPNIFFSSLQYKLYLPNIFAVEVILRLIDTVLYSLCSTKDLCDSPKFRPIHHTPDDKKFVFTDYQAGLQKCVVRILSGK
jgi:hypothetical protein